MSLLVDSKSENDVDILSHSFGELVRDFPPCHRPLPSSQDKTRTRSVSEELVQLLLPRFTDKIGDNVCLNTDYDTFLSRQFIEMHKCWRGFT